MDLRLAGGTTAAGFDRPSSQPSHSDHAGTHKGRRNLQDTFIRKTGIRLTHFVDPVSFSPSPFTSRRPAPIKLNPKKA
jgi:hypothetical protein